MLTAQNVSTELATAEGALAERLNAEGHAPEDIETVSAAHPEGRKRGGVVAVYAEGSARAFYDETACMWFAYDNNYD